MLGVVAVTINIYFGIKLFEAWLLSLKSVETIFYLQTRRHHAAGAVGGQQTAVDGGDGWKRTCKDTSRTLNLEMNH